MTSFSLGRFPAIQECIDAFRRLPGIGPKSAQRIVFYLLSRDKEGTGIIAAALERMKERVGLCPRCFTLGEGEMREEACTACASAGRDPKSICVVEEPADIFAIERAGGYRGQFHALLGAISPLDGVGPEDLTIGKLLNRVKEQGAEEVILALNPKMAGEGTSLYLARVLKPLGVRVTQLAHGLPMGSHLEFADDMTLSRSLEGRREV